MKANFKKMSQLSVEEENFWPSFADIMMLIVMVFLIFLVVMVIKNWDLINKLRTSIEAEQQIAAAADFVVAENKKFKESLEKKNQEIASLQLMLLNSHEDLEETRIRLEESKEAANDYRQQIVILGQEKHLVESELSQNKTALENISKDLEQKNQIIISLEKDMAIVKEDFRDLKYKYNKLIRPARSPKGKTVIEVSLVKKGSTQVIRVKEPDKPAIVRTRQEMHNILSRYREKDPNLLYLKIIFPNDSEISHQDAWNFTSMLLKKYDYYYQTQE